MDSLLFRTITPEIWSHIVQDAERCRETCRVGLILEHGKNHAVARNCVTYQSVDEYSFSFSEVRLETFVRFGGKRVQNPQDYCTLPSNQGCLRVRNLP